jgi:hypothetical protein
MRERLVKMICGSKRGEVSGDGYLRDDIGARSPDDSIIGATDQDCRLVTIGTLSDDELLETFSFYVAKAHEAYEADSIDRVESKQLEAWHTLVHVCRRWRILVFGSPRRLNLRLRCTINRSVEQMLDVWPTLPIVVHGRELDFLPPPARGEKSKNIIAALGLRDRVCEITLCLRPSLFDRFITMTQEPFTGLTRLELISTHVGSILLPDSFLGGYAPLLRSLYLDHVQFPALPKFLLSTNDLVELCLINLPRRGYISPEAMAACLSTLTSLKMFDLRYYYPESPPHRSGKRSSSPSTYINLPALNHFQFHGNGEYIDELVTHISTPHLTYIRIMLVNHLVFDISQVTQFISRVDNFKEPHQAVLEFHFEDADINFSLFEDATNRTTLLIRIPRMESEWRFFSLAETCGLSSSLFRPSSFESLTIVDKTSLTYMEDMDTRWLELLQMFSAVKDLYLCDKLVLSLGRALRGLTGERATLVLPVLQRIFIRRHQKSEAVGWEIGPFITERRLSGHPVAAHDWATVGEDEVANQ